MPRKLLIERDDDCDCAPWWRWRIVEDVTIKSRGMTTRSRMVLAHTITKRGARWKRRRLV